MSDRGKLAQVFNHMVMRQASTMVRNFLLNREKYGKSTLDHPDRDLDAECGYPPNPQVSDYFDWYSREGIATRANDLWPDECWALNPEVYETEKRNETKFEKAWNDLLDEPELNPWHYLHRIDRLSGIGRYGVLFLGYNDRKKLSEPVAGLNDDGTKAQGRPPEGIKLVYMRCFTEKHATIAEVDNDETSPRHGKPRLYEIVLQSMGTADSPDGNEESVEIADKRKDKSESVKIHWTRVIHVPSDNKQESEVYGVPRLQNILNRFFDLRKILAGSAEMFWKGGFPGYSIESMPELMDADPLDKESISEEMQLFMNGLQRYLAVEGVTIKSLDVQVADPASHIMQQLQMIACALNCPTRVLLGTETGQKAGEDETKRWNGRLARRQITVINPFMIRPFIARNILVGALPAPEGGPNKYKISWQDLNSIKDTDKAEIAVKMTQALLQYVTSGAEKIMPLYQFLTNVIKFPHELATKIVAEANKPENKILTKELWKQKLLPGSGQASSANKRSGNRNGVRQTARNTT